MKPSQNHGFTLIELSIVLVIIGLIVGGVLVGQDLIRAAAVRAQISQIEKYNQAVNTFRGKYNFLPGDITPAAATLFNFTAGIPRNGAQGLGDGNGLIEGIGWCCAVAVFYQDGEPLLFWEDLSVNGGNLIDGNFSLAPAYNQLAADVRTTTTVGFISYYPQAKIGNGNYILTTAYNGVNYFFLEAPTWLDHGGILQTAVPGLTVAQAYGIDKKIDDGLPQQGAVLANYIDFAIESGCPAWASGGGVEGAPSVCPL